MNHLKIIAILILALSNHYIFAQNIKYYGYDTMYAYIPSDIIETHNGDFVIIGDVAQSEIQICGMQIQKYLVRTDYKGDTLLTKLHTHFYFGGGNIIEKVDSSLIFLGNVFGSNQCGSTFSAIPLRDYATIHYSSECDSLTTISMSDSCDDIITQYIKNETGGISALHHLEDFFMSFNYEYSIKEMLPNGQVQSVSIGNDVNFDFFSKKSDGYWLLGQGVLRRVDLAGDSIWQITPALPSSMINYFCKVENDNLLFGNQVPFPVVPHLTKTDSIGNFIWDKTYDIIPKHIMVHSTGNYIITGYNTNGYTKIMALNSLGDSIWSRTHFIDYMEALKTIEAQDGRLVTLAWADTNQVWDRMKAMYAVIFDSLDYVLSTPILDKERLHEVSIFPNPSKGVVKLKITNLEITDNCQAEFYNSIGQIVYRSTLKNELSSFDLQHLPKGVYIVSIRNSKSVIAHQKFILGD